MTWAHASDEETVKTSGQVTDAAAGESGERSSRPNESPNRDLTALEQCARLRETAFELAEHYTVAFAGTPRRLS